MPARVTRRSLLALIGLAAHLRGVRNLAPSDSMRADMYIFWRAAGRDRTAAGERGARG